MKHLIIKSNKEVLHRLNSDNLYEVSMKTGKDLSYGLSFTSLENIEERGFKVIDEVEAGTKFKWGYIAGYEN